MYNSLQLDRRNACLWNYIFTRNDTYTHISPDFVPRRENEFVFFCLILRRTNVQLENMLTEAIATEQQQPTSRMRTFEGKLCVCGMWNVFSMRILLRI